jgi:hypothetical protein
MFNKTVNARPHALSFVQLNYLKKSLLILYLILSGCSSVSFVDDYFFP